MSNDQIILTNIKENKKAIVQYSYPDAIVQNRTKAYEFSLRFNGFNPNFSASFDSTYISGVCVKATVSKTNYDLGGTAELVLEHKKSNNISFYVVIPLDFDETKDTPSSLDVLFLEDDELRLLNLDSELNKNKSIYYYKNNDGIDIFVFDTKVYINEKTPGLSDFKLNRIISDSGFKITNAQNVENEIVCEYETQTDTNADVADTNADVADTTTLMSFLFWVSVLSGSMLILAFSLRMVSTKISPNYAVNVYYSLFFAGFVLFIVNIITISTTTDKKLQFTYGALIFLSLIIMLLSRLALFNIFIS